MLNHPDLQPNAVINRWIGGILTFSFKLVHIPAKNFKGTDGLSWRRRADDDTDPEESDKDTDEDNETNQESDIDKKIQEWTSESSSSYDTLVKTFLTWKLSITVPGAHHKFSHHESPMIFFINFSNFLQHYNYPLFPLILFKNALFDNQKTSMFKMTSYGNTTRPIPDL